MIFQCLQIKKETFCKFTIVLEIFLRHFLKYLLMLNSLPCFIYVANIVIRSVQYRRIVPITSLKSLNPVRKIIYHRQIHLLSIENSDLYAQNSILYYKYLLALYICKTQQIPRLKLTGQTVRIVLLTNESGYNNLLSKPSIMSEG